MTESQFMQLIGVLCTLWLFQTLGHTFIYNDGIEKKLNRIIRLLEELINRK